MSNRAVQVLGVTALAGAGYYFYQAGGDPKAAQKRFEADAHKVSNEVQSNLPGSAKEVKKDAEVAGADIQAKASQMARDARAKIDKADAKVGQYEKDAEKELSRAASKTEANLKEGVDKFDKNVTEGAAKAKSGISNWFGGSK